jgi:hypothetical protein
MAAETCFLALRLPLLGVFVKLFFMFYVQFMFKYITTYFLCLVKEQATLLGICEF